MISAFQPVSRSLSTLVALAKWVGAGDQRLISVFMATYKTRAIILSSYPFREHDRIISFYSYHYGRLEARARGSRKIGSKLAGHLEPFLEVELLLANGRHWDILAGSRTLSPRFILRAGLDNLAAAAVCAEAVKLITRPLAQDGRVYNLLSQSLDFLDSPGHNASEKARMAAGFLWQLLSLAGFAPELDNCVNCRRKMEGGGFFTCEGGGMLCQNCRLKDPLAFPLSSELSWQLKAKSFFKPAELQELIIRFWRRIVDYSELKSWRVWQSLVSMKL